MVSMRDPYGHILGFPDRSRYFSLEVLNPPVNFLNKASG
jgi:hypothetical protein